MWTLSLSNFVFFVGLTWGTNIVFNLLYVLKRYVPQTQRFDIPLDGGYSFHSGGRILGESTTLLGLVAALIIAVFALAVGLFPVSIALPAPFLVYAGHMTGSFIKRRLGIPDGRFVPFLDHGDYMLMTGGVLTIIGVISWQLALAALVFTYIFHPIACFVAFKLKLREYPY